MYLNVLKRDKTKQKRGLGTKPAIKDTDTLYVGTAFCKS